MLYDASLHVGNDPVFDAEQKGGFFWRRVVCTSMSIGSLSPITSKVIAMMSPFRSGGASFNGVQPFLWRTRECEEAQAKWPWSFQVGKMHLIL
jgi:hypothetical protein